MSEPEMVNVSLDADEMYPVLCIGAYDHGRTEVPVELVDALQRATERVEAAEGALLDWLHEREPEHRIFRYFPREPK